MPKLKLLLDTNVVIDYLDVREPYYRKARLLMMAGYAGEFELWITSSQITDLVYVLTEGGRHELVPDVLDRLRGLRTFVDVFAVGGDEIDRMLAASWKDPEDSLIFGAALSLKADAIVTRNRKDFESSPIKVFDCEEFFLWIKERYGLDYDEIEI